MVQLFNSVVCLRAVGPCLAPGLSILAKFRGVGSERSSSIPTVVVDAALRVVGLGQLARLCLEEVEVEHQNALFTLLHTTHLGLYVG